jgi:hypothetical protein
VLLVDAAEQRISFGTFVLIPRAYRHAIHPQGRIPLSVVSIMSGASCPPAEPSGNSSPR